MTTNTSARATLIFIALTLLGSSFAAHADESKNGPLFGYSPKGKWIVGGKIANVDPNIAEIRDADATGIVLGYEFAKAIGGEGTSTVELEYLTTDKILVNVLDPNMTTYESDIVNLFFTYRSPGRVYFKVKGGVSYVDRMVNNNVGGLLTPDGQLLLSEEDISFAAGIGLGFRVNEYGVVEVEYSQDSGESNVGILGVNAFLQF